MKITAVIMAGGKGERFWPKSRVNCPKQFLSLTADGETMIQKTVRRLSDFIAPEDVYILTSQNYLELVQEQLPNLPEENLLAEPCPRNTAPCIGLAAGIITKKYQDAVMIVLPSDHLIHAEEIYLNTLRKAVRFAEKGENLLTLGITPTYPETGYGYIKYRRGSSENGIYSVDCFVEKPDLPTAKNYLRSREYLWNSGMFIWKASSILKKIEKHMPDLFAGLEKIMTAYQPENPGNQAHFLEVLNQEFPKLPSESVDFGILEKADDIYTIPGSFGWDDVGSWLALERINPTDSEGNFFEGDIMGIQTKNCTVCGDKKMISLLGVHDLVIVDTPDAMLICDKKHTQDIKKILEQIRTQGKEDLL
ncbi:MAG: NTP transferase domain-containing protein [Oscillospiraceae bacterium]|nr:NTP transferase domain-containing protein [Oscillospiraceae bacterium]